MESKGEGGLASMPSDDHSSADVPSNLNQETTTNKEKDDNQATPEKLKGDEDEDEYEDEDEDEDESPPLEFGVMAAPCPPFNQGEASYYSWLSELKEEELLIVKVQILQSNDDAEKDVKIPKQEAVCRLCSNIFENDNVLKTKCKCKFTLIHQECATEWSREGNNKCNVCDQDIQNIPVFLLKFEASRSEPISSQKVRHSCFRF